MKINSIFWKGKKILITGHTGFKGGWLSIILNQLGSNVSGFALNPEGKNNFFKSAKVKKYLKHDFRKNISNFQILKSCIKKVNPEIIFHLAAQSSVIESFKNSANTITSNIVGTSNILEALKDNKNVKCLIIITTDKVYQNYKNNKFFDENSQLGGDDIYSGSKACCEILVNSYSKSFYSKNKCKIATVRAGNCFGGGDWTKDRIVKDCLETFTSNKTLFLRKPEATRPWQHVLEPLHGYLLLAQKLCSKQSEKFQGPWNFGPNSRQNLKVANFVKIFRKKIKTRSKIVIKKNDKKFTNKKFKVFESKNLSLNSNKALKKLGWKPFLSIKQAADLTIEWYMAFIRKENLSLITEKQIFDYRKKFNLNLK